MPALIVFDLDLTLWHCGPKLWCDQLHLPLVKRSRGEIYDHDGTQVALFHDVPTILAELQAQDYLLALASRTSAPPVARQLLDLFGIASFFAHQAIYPGDKTAHFAALQQETGIPYSEMLFFDDERRNIADVSALGVQSHLITHGLTPKELKSALSKANS